MEAPAADNAEFAVMNRNRSLFLSGRRLCLLPLLFFVVTANAAWAQTAERDHYQIKIGAGYDRGDFGSSETTKVLYFPITFRYLGEKYDWSVTPSIARVEGGGGIRLIEGVPTPTGEQTSSLLEARSSAGDTVVRSRYFLVEGTKTHPAVTPFAKLKIPTAREDLNLGTGKFDAGFGVEVDHQISQTLLFGDLGYTFIGKISGLGMRNRVFGSFGVGERLSETLVLSGMLDWRRSIVASNPDPTELVGVLSYRAGPGLTVSPNVFVGLTSSSSDFGAGLEVSFRFARY
jgi:hypothetical protein